MPKPAHPIAQSTLWSNNLSNSIFALRPGARADTIAPHTTD